MSNQIIAISCALVGITCIIAIIHDVWFYKVTMTTAMICLLLGLSLCGFIEHFRVEDY